VLGVFLIGMRYTTAYGAIGSFIALLLWCYYGICILFFGAEYVQVLEKRRAHSELTPGEPGKMGQDEVPINSNYDSLATAKKQSQVPLAETSQMDDSLLHDQLSYNEVGRELAVKLDSDTRQHPRRAPSQR
ncbi:MAG: YhjD/YihY/BrkB family envelope integrity protein, partial [Pirellula sp.]